MNTKTPSFFGVFLFYSFLLHLVLVFLALTYEKWRWFVSPQKDPVVIRQAIRVDSIGLPDLIQKSGETPPVKKTTSPQAPVLKPPSSISKTKQITRKKKASPKRKKKSSAKRKPRRKVVTKKSQSSQKPPAPDPQEQQKQAIEKLKALSKIEQMRKEVQPARSYRGARLSRGDSQTGEEGDVKNFEMVQYFTSLRIHINMYWSLPQELAIQPLHAKIYVRISDTGRVLNRHILQSSGNEDFDARVLDTMDRAAPFPPPPASVRKILGEGVVFGFPE